MKISWHRVPDTTPTQWYAEMAIDRDVNGRRRLCVVAEAVNTSQTGTDDYPWDWFLTPEGVEHAYNMLAAGSMARPKMGGVESTLRDVKQAVMDLLNPFD